eukprot:22838-Prorocentrum_minimum.AAC.1
MCACLIHKSTRVPPVPPERECAGTQTMDDLPSGGYGFGGRPSSSRPARPQEYALFPPPIGVTLLSPESSTLPLLVGHLLKWHTPRWLGA